MSALKNPGWRADCPKCVASKFTCDEHYVRDIPTFRYRDHLADKVDLPPAPFPEDYR